MKIVQNQRFKICVYECNIRVLEEFSIKRKPKKLAVTAVMRKILLTSMGVLRNQQPFDPDWAEKNKEKIAVVMTSDNNTKINCNKREKCKK